MQAGCAHAHDKEPPILLCITCLLKQLPKSTAEQDERSGHAGRNTTGKLTSVKWTNCKFFDTTTQACHAQLARPAC